MNQEVFTPKENSPVEKELIQKWQAIVNESKTILDAAQEESERFGVVARISKKILIERENLASKKDFMSPQQFARLEQEYQKMMSFVLETFSKAPKYDVTQSFFKS